MPVLPVFYKAVDGPSPGLSRNRWPIAAVARARPGRAGPVLAGPVLARSGIADIPGGTVTAAGQ